MNTNSSSLQLSLEDLLGELQHARRQEDLSRLALLAYCEVRRWARQAGEPALAERSTELVTRTPPVSREQFMAVIDDLIAGLENAHQRLCACPDMATA
ncbi:MAG: hypothetical protein ACKOXQ_04845 [Hydrogenophaga sp.]